MSERESQSAPPFSASGRAAGSPTAGVLGRRVSARLAFLGAALRAAGVRVGIGELLAAHRAIAAVDPASSMDAYLAARTVLCSRRQDLPAFDAAWAECFRGLEAEPPAVLAEATSLALPRTAVPGGEPSRPKRESAFDPVVLPSAWSEEEVLREKDFAHFTGAERALARRLMARLTLTGSQRLSRRSHPVRHRGEHQDLRRTLRASLRYEGEPVERRWRSRTTRPRPVVLVLDVSGSMEPYARMLLQYLQVSVLARRRVEAFAFGTRLTRITRELAERDPDRALERAAAAVVDFSGGTRIGAALSELNRAHGRRVGRGAVVVVLSDGWDRGDPELLAAEMERLARCAHRLVWLNPLKARPDYEPLTRGMRAALPHVDLFRPGNTMASLAEVAELLEEA
ncbi:MAG: vWA domain-containing protein [Thermoleophilaceae bacterium]